MNLDRYGTGIYEDRRGKTAQRRIWIVTAAATALWFVSSLISNG
jgi:hypothetical protein